MRSRLLIERAILGSLIAALFMACGEEFKAGDEPGADASVDSSAGASGAAGASGQASDASAGGMNAEASVGGSAGMGGAAGQAGAGGEAGAAGQGGAAGQSGAGGAPLSCSDGIKNGAETAEDCGGDACPPCSNQKACNTSSDCASGYCASSSCSPFVKRFGGSLYDVARSVAVTPAGDTLIAGLSRGTINLGGNNMLGSGAFLAKLKANGEHVWSKQLPTSPSTDDSYLGYFGIDLAVDATGNVYAAGSFFPPLSIDGLPFPTPEGGGGALDIYLVKLSPDGDVVWMKSFGGNGYDYAGVSVSPAGEVFLFGTFGSDSIVLGDTPLMNTSQPANSTYDVFVASFSAAGEYQWSKRFGSTGTETVADLRFGPGGQVILAGNFDSKLEFGTTQLSTLGYWDMYVASLDGSGNAQWAGRYGGGAFSDSLSSIDVMQGGDLLIAGTVEGQVQIGNKGIGNPYVDMFAARLSGADGSAVWARSFDAEASESAGPLVSADAQGNAILAGAFQTAWVNLGGVNLNHTPLAANDAGAPADTDFFVARLAGANGAHLDSAAFGAPGIQRPHALAVSSKTGNLLMAGAFEQTFELAGTTLSSQGGLDVFLASLGKP